MAYTKQYVKNAIVLWFRDHTKDYAHETTRDQEMAKVLKIIDGALE